MAKSVTIKAAGIMAVATLLAAGVYGLFAYFGSHTERPPVRNNISTGDQPQVPVMVTGQACNITINYNVPETKTKEAVETLEKKVNDSSSVISLTRDEIRLLSQALKDLDQRTPGIDKLPDGRTIMGQFVAGEPVIVLQEHQASIEYFERKDFPSAFVHSTNAIQAFAASQGKGSIRSGDLPSESTAKLYLHGALVSHRLAKHDVALNRARTAYRYHPEPESKTLEAASLANLGRRDETRSIVFEALKANPDNPNLNGLRTQLGE